MRRVDSKAAVIAVTLVTLLVVSVVVWKLTFTGTDVADNHHSPIVIEGEEDLITANGVTGGSGTSEDPYLIEDWEIEVVSGESVCGISIRSVSSHVMIRGVTVCSSGFNLTENYGHPSGIYLVSVFNCVIVDCEFQELEVAIEAFDVERMNVTSNSFESCHRGVASSGIHSSNSIRDSTIESNTFRDCDGSVEVLSVRNLTVMGNVFEGQHVAVYLQDAAEASLSENTIRGSTICAAWIEGGSNYSIRGNTVESSNSSGVRLHQVGHTIVANNTVESQQVSLLVDECIDVVVEHNLLTDCSMGPSLNCGLEVIDSAEIVVRFNSVENNQLGVVLVASDPASMDVVVYNNNFRANAVNAIDNCGSENQWDNGYPGGGNFWGVAVVDEDGDGIGDEEYLIDSDSVDHYPMVNPLTV